MVLRRGMVVGEGEHDNKVHLVEDMGAMGVNQISVNLGVARGPSGCSLPTTAKAK